MHTYDQSAKLKGHTAEDKKILVQLEKRCFRQGTEDLNPEKEVKGFPWMVVAVLSYLSRGSKWWSLWLFERR